ncbi:MAG: lysylphosphatidylglycerol synthase transmembrane domain-containing protein [Chloroflexota bacterium]
MPRNFLVRAVAGVAVSVVALWLVLRSVDLQETADVLRTADWRWIVVLTGFLCVDLAVRTLRWQRLLAPIAHVPYRHTLGYLLVGYLANNVLPARIGELVRSHYAGDREGISRSTTLGTIVVERVVDLVTVVAIASVSILVLSVRGIVASAVLAGVAVAGLFAVVLALGIAAHRLPGADRLAAWASRYPRVRDAVARLRDGLRVAGRPRTLLEALILSGIAWGSTILAFAAAGQSVGVELTIGQAALMASGVALASAIPAGPASLGTFELAAVEIGKAVGVGASEAFAIGLIAHVSILVVTSVGGIIGLGWLGLPRDATRATPEDGLGDSASGGG